MADAIPSIPSSCVGESDSVRDRRASALRKAAADKHDQAVARADTGIRKLVKSGEDINFRSVSRAAGVSLDFLYSQPGLRERIETLRGQQSTKPPAHAAATTAEGTVIRALTESLRRERSTNRERVHDLEQRLAAAHGEILQLQRRLREHGLNTERA